MASPTWPLRLRAPAGGPPAPSPAAAAAGIALLGLLLAFGTAGWVRARNARVASDRFEVAAGRILARIEDRLARYPYGLRGVRGAVIAAGEGALSRAAFARFSASRDVAREFPGARGFGFVRRVRPGEEAAFLAAVRAQDEAGFAIRELAPNPGERFVIRLVEPLAQNRDAVGLDVASEPERRDAALRSADSGRPAITGPITLVQAPGQVEEGFLLFLPVFVPDRPVGTAQERRAALLGWAYAPLVIGEVLAGLDLDPDEIDIAIGDPRARPARRFFASAGMDRAPETGLSTVRRLAAFDRTWDVAVRARAAFLTDINPVPPAAAGVLALLVGLLGAGLAYLHLAGRRRAVLAAVETNRLAAIVENADEAILGKTLDGVITDWNPGAERLFGFTAAEAVGARAEDLIFPSHLRGEERETLAAIGRGEPVPARSTLRMRRGGGMVHVLVSVSPIRGPGGALAGAATVMRDIGERVASEERIRALNASLERQVAERTEALRSAAAFQAAILQHAAYAIIATDTGGRITVFNPAAERMLGYAASEVVGRASPMLFHDPAEVADRARRLSAARGRPVEPGPEVLLARGEGLPDIAEWTYLAKDGGRLPVLLSASALHAEGGAVLGTLAIAMDLSERHRHAAEMRAANAGTWSYDIGSGRVRISAACARQHGLPDAETELHVETQWRPLAHPDDAPRVLADLQAAIEAGGAYTTEFRVPLPAGGPRWLTAIGRVEGAGGPHPGRVIGLTLDITARKEAEQALDEARREAERANRSKSDFLATMSHEIRTPLNAILGFADLMLGSDALAPDLRRHAELVRSSGSALLTVVNDLLDVSRIEAGALVLDARPFSPGRLAESCIAILDGLARPRGLALRLALEPGLPPRLLGDEARLRQVLLNLLNNAVKFTDAGAVTLTVAHEGSDAAGERLRFAVRDTGIGIRPDRHDRLFKRFSQVDASVERAFGGAGLGLAICKALVGLMGGEIGFESAPGAGSTFWFALRLPRAAADAAEADPGRQAPARRGRLLLVEDNPVNQELARAVLERAGHAVAVAGDGAQAVRAHAQGGFDAVLMDVQMPVLDGLSATRAIRDLPGRLGEVPIIGLSAGVLPGEIRLCRQAGMDDHVGKPFEAAALLATLDRWLPGAPPPEAAAGPAFDPERFGLFAGQLSPERLRHVLVVIDDDLSQAFREPAEAPADRARLRFEAHALGATAAMAGLSALSQACRDLCALDEARVAGEGPDAFGAALGRVRAATEAARAEIRARTPAPAGPLADGAYTDGP